MWVPGELMVRVSRCRGRVSRYRDGARTHLRTEVRGEMFITLWMQMLVFFSCTTPFPSRAEPQL